MFKMHGSVFLVTLLLIDCAAIYRKAVAGKNVTLQGNLDPCALYASKVKRITSKTLISISTYCRMISRK